MLCAVTTAPRPIYTLEDSLDSIRDAGFPTPTVFAEPGSTLPADCVKCVLNREKLGSWGNFKAAIAYLLESDAPRIAVFQDDIQLSRNAIDLLPDGDVVSLYTAAAQSHAEPGWREFSGSYLYGALALVMSHRFAEYLLQSKVGRGSQTMTDAWISRIAKEGGFTIWQHNPSLCRHTGVKSSIDPMLDLRREQDRNCGEFVEDCRAVVPA